VVARTRRAALRTVKVHCERFVDRAFEPEFTNDRRIAASTQGAPSRDVSEDTGGDTRRRRYRVRTSTAP
jgi:hypothetical protein